MLEQIRKKRWSEYMWFHPMLGLQQLDDTYRVPRASWYPVPRGDQTWLAFIDWNILPSKVAKNTQTNQFIISDL